MNNKSAKEWLAKYEAGRAKPGNDAEAEELQERRKVLKTKGTIRAREDERQQLITTWAERDTPITSGQAQLALHYLGVMIVMCRLAWSFAIHPCFRMFLKVIRPSFEKTLNNQSHRKFAGPLLDELHAETCELVEDTLSRVPGLITVGIDGHKDGRSRTLETVTKAKLGVSVFAGCHYMLTQRATGPHLAELLKPYLLANPNEIIAIVADNTSSNVAMFDELAKVNVLKPLFFLGCFVHVMDLLVEDIAKIPAFETIGSQAHSTISFVKRHATIYEEFLSIKGRLGVHSDLHLFPTTRFAYLHLMLRSLQRCMLAVRGLVDSPVYTLTKENTRRRGGEDGRKAFETFKQFEETISPVDFGHRLGWAAQILMPISKALHYLEGDSVPLSHVYPVYQCIYDYAQTLPDELSLQQFLSEEEFETITEVVKDRWGGTSRKKGLKADIHLLAYVLDPYAQGALTSPSQPQSDLIDGAALDRARAAMRHHITEPDRRQVMAQQLLMWISSRPGLRARSAAAGSSEMDAQDGADKAEPKGDTAYSSLYFTSMEMMWDKAEARELAMQAGKQKRDVPDEHDVGYTVCETIARLKLTLKPTIFWEAMLAEAPGSASKEAKEGHRMFASTARNLSSIVGHTCGVERAGKAYNLIMTSHRKHMRREVASKAAFVLNNYNLMHKEVDLGDCISDFAGSFLVDDEVREELQAKRVAALRRGILLTDAELMEGDANSGGQVSDSDDDGDGDERQHAPANEIMWGQLPEGLVVAAKPTHLGDELVRQIIYYRWKKFGWLIGTIVQKFDSSTPRLLAKFNYRIEWMDGWENHNLMLDNYMCGADAPYDSWVLLRKAVEEVGMGDEE